MMSINVNDIAIFNIGGVHYSNCKLSSCHAQVLEWIYTL